MAILAASPVIHAQSGTSTLVLNLWVFPCFPFFWLQFAGVSNSRCWFTFVRTWFMPLLCSYYCFDSLFHVGFSLLSVSLAAVRPLLVHPGPIGCGSPGFLAHAAGLPGLLTWHFRLTPPRFERWTRVTDSGFGHHAVWLYSFVFSGFVIIHGGRIILSSPIAGSRYLHPSQADSPAQKPNLSPIEPIVKLANGLPEDLLTCPITWCIYSGNHWQPNVLSCFFLTLFHLYTSSTAQGGGGSFKNRKPIGEIGCCESGMAERIH